MVGIVQGELKMISTVVGCSLPGFIAPKMENKIYAFPPTSSPELVHAPGLFQIDEVSNKHRFYSFSVSLYQILPSNNTDRRKNF